MDCAKKGRPSGGLKDSIPPVITRSFPENFTTNFSEDEIKITFDEYIKLKDITKELIVSPPLKYPPIITPTSISKTLRIKILDTLRENTTYSFNFGNSIIDNNEGNIFPNYKYVFSTGTFIDSLTLKGTVIDALLAETKDQTSILLYEIDENYTDSIIFNEKPNYITTTAIDGSDFELTNIKEGTYQLIAIKETTNNYTFQPDTDKIAFYPTPITLPSDSTFQIKLFKELTSYKASRPKLESKNRISFGYKGNGDSLKIRLLSEMSPEFESIVLKQQDKDTLNFWFKPEVTNDSLLFETQYKTERDTFAVRMRELYADSLQLTPKNVGAVALRDTLEIQTNTPLISLNKEQISIMNGDSLAIEFTSRINPKTNSAQIIFPKKEEQYYSVTMLEGALVDFFENESDSIVYKQNVKPLSDYATLTLNLVNANEFPIIAQLVDEKFEVVDEMYLTETKPIYFEYIKPGNYFVRLLYDENENKKWDTGNFLSRTAPEKVVYYPTKIELRPNWSWNETFMLE
ncbi:MAG: Ig-like domain-containing protein [Patiriisocius sp.]|uniref:Ig-like domain-containing protein n=1 Tax=Patiriisocius sp. TaxID=2822396 RepID=UPI003EF8A9EE